ncbi:unnamed protein product [Linum trigynum]|uniref:Uncharacterized protein n=1 Tax=Linum trigynum TaxID=586398 RepID=A0AAV2C954_9ROSI
MKPPQGHKPLEEGRTQTRAGGSKQQTQNTKSASKVRTITLLSENKEESSKSQNGPKLHRITTPFGQSKEEEAHNP